MAFSAGSFLKDTASGVGTGASAGGGAGAVAGGVIGAFTNLISQGMDEARRSELSEAIDNAGAGYDKAQAANKAMLDQYYAGDTSLGTADDAERYRQMLAGYDPNEFVYDFGSFDKEYDINDYYAPNRQQLIDKVTDQTQSTAAGAGIGRGSGAANMIATAVADKNEELYKNALQEMKDARDFDYRKYSDEITNRQKQLDAKSTATNNLMTQLSTLGNSYYQDQADKLQNYLDLSNNSANTALQLALAKASIT